MQDQQPVPAPPADPFAKHRLDLSAMEAGKWIDVQGDKFLVASYSAEAVARERAAARAELGLAADAEVPAHKAEWVAERVFARAILRGMRLRAHPGMLYTTEVGARIYSDPELFGLRSQIQREALGDFTKDAVAKAAVLGNS